MTQHAALARAAAGVLATALLAGCSGGHAAPRRSAAADAPLTATTAVDHHGASLAALRGGRARPDVLVTGALSPRSLQALTALAPGAATYAVGSVRVGSTVLRVASVDPASFRRFTPAGTAEATALWEQVAGGQLVASHAVAKRLRLSLGRDVTVRGSRPATLRLGGLATTGVPGTDLVVSSGVGALLGVTRERAVLLSAGKADPARLASRARTAAGHAARVDLLTAPAASPVAFLTGSRAARAFGAFSYRYYPDGTIEPDSRWVRENIATQSVPILGHVTCHRLMLPQLRGALRDVVAAGLGDTIHTYSGCYVPRFMERDPSHPVSLHTWGIAIDIDAATNGRGTRGTMDPRVVTIFKQWGFRWGGDWSWTDPMHFELGALLKTSG